MQKSTSPKNDVCDEPPMGAEETKAWLETVLQDFWYKHQMSVTRQAFRAATGRPMGKTRARLDGNKFLNHVSRLRPKIENREIIFVRASPHFIHVPLPTTYTKLRRIASLASWTLHARCCSCSDNRWLPVMMNGKEFVLCYTCLPPSQYPSLGAKLVARSLIAEATKRYLVEDFTPMN